MPRSDSLVPAIFIRVSLRMGHFGRGHNTEMFGEGLLFQAVRKRVSEEANRDQVHAPCVGVARRMPGVTRWLEGDYDGIASESPREGCVTLDHIRDNTKQYDSKIWDANHAMEPLRKHRWVHGDIRPHNIFAPKPVQKSGEIDVRFIDCYYFGKENVDRLSCPSE